MSKQSKERIAFEVIMILMMLALFCLITRLWPLLFLVVPGILIAAIRLLFVSAKKNDEPSAPISAPPEPQRPETEQDVIRIAFGILQRRITEQVISRYPSARWIWDVPNAIERFSKSESLTILLNSAGGFRRAAIQVSNLQFCGVIYDTTDTGRPDEPPPEADADGDPGYEGEPESDEQVDYALIAFQWVEANLLTLNNRCNDSIAEGLTTLLIPAGELPHPDSWTEVCAVLTCNGFREAVAQENGIRVSLPE